MISILSFITLLSQCFVPYSKMPAFTCYDLRVMAGRPQINEAPVFSRNLAALRKAKGWTQPQLAKMLDITTNALVYYERQAKNPTATFLEKVAKVFNVSIDELLGHKVATEHKPGPPSRLEQLTQQLATLPRQKQKAVVEILEGYLKAASPS